MMQRASTEQLRMEGNAVTSLLPWGASKVHCASLGHPANWDLKLSSELDSRGCLKEVILVLGVK